MKAQLLIVSRYFRAVNPVLTILVVLAFLYTGCGFKLNRNRITLPADARSISLQQIDNKSFTPGLDILLKEQLLDRFSRNAIKLLPPKNADLLLRFQITTTQHFRHDYALDNATKSYEFVFSVSGRLTVIDNRDQTNLFQRIQISGNYSFKTENPDLSQTEISDGRIKVLETLADKIVNKLSQNF